MITYERQKDGTLKQVDSPPKRAELVEQRIYDRCIVRVGQLEAEKITLEARIDELCAEVERLHADQAHWELGNCPSCPNVASLQEALEQNAKLRELAARMARALGVGRWCSADCGREFGCDWTPDGCPIANAMRELGVDK